MGQEIEQTGGKSGCEKNFWECLKDRCEDWEALFLFNLDNVIKLLRNSPHTYLVIWDEEILARWNERESEEGAGQHRTFPMVLRFRMRRGSLIWDDEGRVICLTRMMLDHAVRVLMQEAIDDGIVLELWEERG